MFDIILDIETSSLEATTGHITAIGVLWSGGLKEFTAPANLFRVNPELAERTLLDAAIKWPYQADYLVTYCGEMFDVPFLKTRLLFQGFQDTDIQFLNAPHHLDLSHFTKELNNNVRIGKDYAADKFCGQYVPRSTKGSFLSAIYRQKIVTDEEHADMLGHLAIDLIATYKMFQKFNTYPEFERFYEGRYPGFREWCK